MLKTIITIIYLRSYRLTHMPYGYDIHVPGWIYKWKKTNSKTPLMHAYSCDYSMWITVDPYNAFWFFYFRLLLWPFDMELQNTEKRLATFCRPVAFECGLTHWTHADVVANATQCGWLRREYTILYLYVCFGLFGEYEPIYLIANVVWSCQATEIKSYLDLLPFFFLQKVNSLSNSPNSQFIICLQNIYTQTHAYGRMAMKVKVCCRRSRHHHHHWHKSN